MRNDLIGLISLMYKNAFLKLDIGLFEKGKRIYIMLNKVYLRSFLSCLRYSSFWFGTTFHDITIVPLNNFMFNNMNIVIYIFYVPRYNIKLFVIINVFKEISSLTEFFPGSGWPEREAAEMYGIIFTNKIDMRKLLLDYTMEGYPLQKQFDVVGYEEIEYNVFEN